MSGCNCKGKDNEIFCNCQFGTVTLKDFSGTISIELTTDTIKVTEKDWVAKIDTMVDLEVVDSTSPSDDLNIRYVVERVTGGMTTTLCEYVVVDERDPVYILTPNNTVCDHPPLGCHMYRLSVLDNGTGSLVVNSNCRCINVITFPKGD
ncbi:hypothetical protein [Bacillus sp. SM2101]|uniref:hypothetical protein n=1 Tax=Bacillus sp. SM2101 TaxID=2805366 RepID=UPI001BDEBDB5|nr:hypothetical protein [Bacillus sp. SM2101]